MANALYRKEPDGVWINQANPGGPSLMSTTPYSSSNAWTYVLEWASGLQWIATPPTALQTQAQAQATLDAYAAQLNAGTA
jgi:hypothetical protein